MKQINNEEKILELLTSMKQEISGIKQEISDIKQEISGIKQEQCTTNQKLANLENRFDKMEQNNTRDFEILAKHMTETITRLDTVEELQKNTSEKLDVLPIMQARIDEHEWEIRKVKQKLIS